MDPTPPTLGVSQGSPLFARAREIDARLRARSAERKQSVALDAFDLLECKRLGLFSLLGYSSVTAYARAVNGFGSSKTSALIRIAEAAEGLPRIRKAFLAGRLHWCAAEQIVKKATPQDEAEWLEKARIMSVSQLKAHVNEDNPTYWRKLELDREDLFWVESLVDFVRRQNGPFAFGKAIAFACRKMLEEGGLGPGGPSARVVLDYCPRCKEATGQTSEGPAPVSPEQAEQLCREGSVVDLREVPAAAATQSVPRRIQDHVMARDRTCVVPGCSNRILQLHHEDGRENGHDPARCFGLCGAHHRARHKGFLRTQGSMPDLHFFLADGTPLGRAGDEQRASAASSPTAGGPGGEAVSACAETPRSDAPAESPPASVASACAETPRPDAPAESPPAPVVSACADTPRPDAPAESPQASVVSACAEALPASDPPEEVENPVDDALGALTHGLKLTVRKARALVQQTLRRYPGRDWEASELVRAVLEALPSPG